MSRILFVLAGFPMLFAPVLGGKLTGAILTAFGVLLLWGSPTVVVNTAGQDRRAAKGAPWQRRDASAFIEAIRAQLFREQK